MKTITVRNLPDDVHSRLVELASANHRNVEAHVRYLIEREVATAPVDTCGDLVDRIWNEPAPEVDLKTIDKYLATRGRRSNRP